MKQHSLPVVEDNSLTIDQISGGWDIWRSAASLPLKSFCLLYLHKYAALPTNTQFIERGAKESGYVFLGRRGETNRIVFKITRGKTIPDVLKKGRKEIQLADLNPNLNKKAKQLQGKKQKC